jgi:hypothetical protein
MRNDRAEPVGNRLDIQIEGIATAAEVSPTATTSPGSLGAARRNSTISIMVKTAISALDHGKAVGAFPQRPQLRQEIRRHLSLNRQSEEIRELTGSDDHRNADRKAVDNRFGDMPDQAAGTKKAGDQQDNPRHECGDQKPVIAVIGDDRIHHDNERAGRSADLHPAAAERRYQKSGDNRG